ncbi:MAG: hypothetical protein E7062_03720 [Spirochaetaceae bacterium]|nr:hypothetical protein [Spirochaetaceae bacterium]
MKKIIFVFLSSFLLFSCIVDDWTKEYYLTNENAKIYVLNYTSQDVGVVIKDEDNNTLINKNIPPQKTNDYQENYAKLKEDFGEGTVYFTRHGQYLSPSQNPFVIEDSNLILSSLATPSFEGLTIYVQNGDDKYSSVLLSNQEEKKISFPKSAQTELVAKQLEEGKFLFANIVGDHLIADYEDIGSIHLKNPQYIIVIAPELSEGTK